MQRRSAPPTPLPGTYGSIAVTPPIDERGCDPTEEGGGQGRENEHGRRVGSGGGSQRYREHRAHQVKGDPVRARSRPRSRASGQRHQREQAEAGRLPPAVRGMGAAAGSPARLQLGRRPWRSQCREPQQSRASPAPDWWRALTVALTARQVRAPTRESRSAPNYAWRRERPRPRYPRSQTKEQRLRLPRLPTTRSIVDAPRDYLLAHQALARAGRTSLLSLGLVAALGEACVLLAAMAVLPAVLVLAQRGRATVRE